MDDRRLTVRLFLLLACGTLPMPCTHDCFCMMAWRPQERLDFEADTRRLFFTAMASVGLSIFDGPIPGSLEAVCVGDR